MYKLSSRHMKDSPLYALRFAFYACLMCAALIVLVYQLPFTYRIDAGIERGNHSDLPFMQDFNLGEWRSPTETWRWSRPQSLLEIPGVGQRPLLLTLRVISHRGHFDNSTLPPLTLRFADGSQQTFWLRMPAADYTIPISPHMLEQGNLRVQIITEGWQAPGDRRGELGVAVAQPISLRSTYGGFVLPDDRLMLGWLLALLLFWITLQIIRFPPGQNFWLMLVPTLLIPLAVWIDAPRLAFGWIWIVIVGLIAVASALFCRLVVPRILTRYDTLPSAPILRWLLFLMVLIFAMKYSSRLYPDSMPGDLQLHVNRYFATVMGDVYINAQHRGLPFPFPSGLYVMIAPFQLLGIDIHDLFQLGAGFFETSTIVIFYLLIRRLGGSFRFALLGAATYALTAVSHMNTWFSFQTQVMAQWAAILFLFIAVARWQRYRIFDWVAMATLVAMMHLGHIGTFLNASIMMGLVSLWLLWQTRRDSAQRASSWQLIGSFAAGTLFVILFYYSAFITQYWDEIVAVSTVGLNGVTKRDPIPRSETLSALWNFGLIDHFGAFPLLLTLPGLLLLRRWRSNTLPLVALIVASLLVSAGQAVLPLITLSSLTTRWLTFSAWAICLTGAWAWLLLRKHGIAARWASWGIAGFVLWVTAQVWINATFLRMPPIEPF